MDNKGSTKKKHEMKEMKVSDPVLLCVIFSAHHQRWLIVSIQLIVYTIKLKDPSSFTTPHHHPEC